MRLVCDYCATRNFFATPVRPRRDCGTTGTMIDSSYKMKGGSIFMARQIDVSTLGGRIKYRRTVAGMTQENLAELMYVKHGLISQYENNVVQPSVDKLQEIARILETSVGYLVDGVESYITEEQKQILAALESIENEVIKNSLIAHIKQVASASHYI